MANMAEDGASMDDGDSPISLQELYQALEQSTNAVGPQRAEAEALLRSWESTAKPGFFVGLIQVVKEYSNVGEVSCTWLRWSAL
jgi:hypothetical protein